MNDRYRYSLRDFNDCGCCTGDAVRTPRLVDNRHGLNRIDYRVGDHSRFKQSMLSMLSSTHFNVLQGLQTRENDDFSIALIDAWATVADVLTFYQERIANESYLHTATERMSLLELARLIGYRLNPGVAASTHLAYTLDTAPGNPSLATTQVRIEQGAKVQSTPGPEETAQLFETIEAIDARVEWNAMRPRLTQLQHISTNMGSVVLNGTTSRVEAEDYVLIIDADNKTQVRRVRDVTRNDADGTTRLDFLHPQLSPPTYERPVLPRGRIDAFAPETLLTEEVAQIIVAKTWHTNDLRTLAEIQTWALDDLAAEIDRVTAADEIRGSVHIFRVRASLFGYNAPKIVTYDNEGTPDPADAWIDWKVNTNVEKGNVVYLEGEHKSIAPDSYIQIRTPYAGLDIDNVLSEVFDDLVNFGGTAPKFESSQNTVHQISNAAVVNRTDYGISGKSTKLTLPAGDSWWDPSTAGFANFIRQYTVLSQSESLPTGCVPIEDPIAGDVITLNRAYLHLESGRTVALSGEVEAKEGELRSEILTIKDVRIEAGFTVLEFETALKERYVRRTVILNANMAPATHGETVQEILGSGDAGQAFQAFVLKQKPLTHVAADTATGSASTLEVRVDGVLWRQVPHFLDRGANDRVYVTRMGDDGTTTVHFGDGVNGARVPSGQNNVRATYRKDIGLAGLLQARQINQLMTRPLGVKEAVNPLAPNGADDAETRDAARDNAPITVRTLDRTVSLRDYEHFTRAFAGVAKAQAVQIWDGKTQRVFVTVAGPGGAAIENNSNIYDSLLGALKQAGDPYVNLDVKTYRPAFFRVAAGVYVDADYLADNVIVDVKQTLRDMFSFERRDFNQSVNLSEVFSAIQAVAGVNAVDMDACYRSEETVPVLKPRLFAAGAMRTTTSTTLAAELLLLDPTSLDGIKVIA